VGACDGVERDLHLKSFVENEEGLQEVLFAPGSALIDHPCARILVRQTDIVDVDPYPWGQAGEEIKEDPVNVAASLDGVCRVDEQHIAGIERSCYFSCV
jgi:hypothetical protein